MRNPQFVLTADAPDSHAPSGVSRRQVLIAVFPALYCGVAYTQAFPSKPIRLVVPFPAGGGADFLARLLAQKISASMGQPLIVDNKPGANGMIGLDNVAKAAPDGYTIVMATSSYPVTPALVKSMPFDPVKDLTPISLVASAPIALVAGPAMTVNTAREFVAYAKANPGKLNYGSSGNGGFPHVSTELFLSAAGIKATHVPYKGGATALNELVAGQIDFMFVDLAPAIPHFKSGKLRPLAVTGAQRSRHLPDVPTLVESGVAGDSVLGWYGLLAPAGTPQAVIARLRDEVSKALAQEDVKEKLARTASDPVGSTPEDFAKLIRDELPRWARIVKSAGIVAE